MKFEKFDIVLVDFPFTDLTQTKKRPALVLRSLEGDNNILCQITTKRRTFHKYEVNLLKESCSGNIKFNSHIYIDMIFTLHKNLIYGKIGKIINSPIKESINNKIKEIFV